MILAAIPWIEPRASHRGVGGSKNTPSGALREMKVLIDECLPAALKENLTALGHERQTVRQAGFGSKKNGELLTLAEWRCDVLLTSDRNIEYQQNMTGRSVAILILFAKSNRMKDLLPLMLACAEALRSVQPGVVIEVKPL
jgi:predicted nuclease of predicted toxin-antitoxin system